MALWWPAYVGIGSNLGDPQQHLAGARSAIAALDDVLLVLTSPIYRTDPWGKEDQPRFLNQAVGLLVQLEPAELLRRLQAIERAHGRDRGSEERWGPRPLDLDLIAFAGRQIHEPGLQLPHPRANERAFVLGPLADIAPDLMLPGYGRVRNLLKVLDLSGLEPADTH